MTESKRAYYIVPADRLEDTKETLVRYCKGQATLYRKWRWSQGMGLVGEVFACRAWHLLVDQAAYDRWLADPDAFYELHFEREEDEVLLNMFGDYLESFKK